MSKLRYASLDLRLTRNDVAEGEYVLKALEMRQAHFLDRQIMGTAENRLVYSEAGLARAIADELRKVLRSIQRRNKVEREQSDVNDFSERYNALVEQN